MSTQKVKYPRSYHVLWSPGSTSDDRFVQNMNHFHGQEVVVTEKMDGENTSIANNFCHARSLDSPNHPSRWYVNKLQSELKFDIPEGMRICGENCYALHSIPYTTLEDFFLVFSIWKDETCLSWDETLEWCNLLGLKTVPVLYRGIYDEEKIKSLFVENREPDLMEGYVIRLTSSFTREDFTKSLNKYVRKGHVKPDDGHWLSKPVTPNKTKSIVGE